MKILANAMIRKFFVCNCGDCSHNFAISYDPNCSVEDSDYLYLHVHLVQYDNFFARVYKAFRYIFNLESADWGHYTEIILNKAQTDELVEFINNMEHN